MGSGASKTSKHVVIVGAGYAGLHLAKALKGRARFTLVDPRAEFFHNIGAPRLLAQPGFASKLTFPLRDFVPAEYGEFLQGTVTSVDAAAKTVTVSLADGGAEKIVQYDALCLATGSTQALFKPHDVRGRDTAARFEQIAAGIDSAKSVLIVGGGPVGVEVAGELAEKYKSSKAITLVTARDRLLDASVHSSVSGKLVKQLGKMGVEVVFSDRVDCPDDVDGPVSLQPRTLTSKLGQRFESDVQIWAVGGARLNSECWRDSFETTASGHIVVGEDLRVAGHADVYALGDITSGSHLAATTEKQASVIANNLVNNSHAQYKPDNMMLVNLGTKGGAAMLPNGMVVGPFLVSKIKAQYYLDLKFHKFLTNF